jgi:selenide,water dikinase
VERNREYAATLVSKEKGVSPEWETVLYDPQTSGGLLIAIPEERSARLVALLRERGVAHAGVVGAVTEASSGKIRIRSHRPA